MLKFHVRNGKIVDKLHEIKQFKKNKWLEKRRSFITQKRNLAEKDFEGDFYKSFNNAFYGQTMENVRNRSKVQLNKKDDIEKVIKQQSNFKINNQ